MALHLVMLNIFRSAKTNILLFAVGFVAAFLFAVMLIQTEKQRGLKPSQTLSCLILMKNNHKKYLSALKRTWIDGCDWYHIVEPIHPRKSIPSSNSKTISSNTLTQIINDYVLCHQESQGAVIKVTGRTGWSILCKALHLVKAKGSHWTIVLPDNLMLMTENLRYFIKHLDWRKEYYLGYAIKNHLADFNILSAGILLSNATLEKLLDHFQTEEACDGSGRYWRNEDVYLGKYLKDLGILPKDTRDTEGRGRFHGYSIHNLLKPGKLFNKSDYKRNALYPVPEGFNCCSPHIITLDIPGPDSFYHHYYFYKMTFHQKPKNGQENSVKKTEDFNWKKFLREEGYSETTINKMNADEYYKIWEKKISPDTLYKMIRDSFA